MEASMAIIIGAALATCGWLYTGRRARTLSRKQHTINVMLQASFNADFVKARNLVADVVGKGKLPDLNLPENEELRIAFRMVANHYEFVAAGLRNGDFDERLVRDSERGTLLGLFEKGQDFIWSLRNARRRTTIYEHLEWLHGRWEKKPPGYVQICVEFCAGRPLPSKRVNPRA